MSSSFGLRTKGNTSSFTCFISDVERRSMSFSLNNSGLISSLLNCLHRSAKWVKSSGTLWRTYHSKSYQSRPFTLFFHARYTNACILPANKSGSVKQRVINEYGWSNSFCSVLKFNGGQQDIKLYNKLIYYILWRV